MFSARDFLHLPLPAKCTIEVGPPIMLDGMASAGPLCEQVSPTYRALRLFGVYRNRDEVVHVAGQLRSAIR